MISDRSIAEVPAYFSPLGRLRMLAGDAALDFANTRHWRDGEEIDFLTDYQALADWAVPAGLIDEAERAAIAEAIERLPEEARRVHARGLELRDRWKERLAGMIDGLGDDGASDALRQTVAEALSAPALAITGLTATTSVEKQLDLPLARLALAIAAFMALPRTGTLRMCEADPCGGVFLDTSRSQKRRWCAMDSCGNRAKAQRHRQRFKAEAVEPDAG